MGRSHRAADVGLEHPPQWAQINVTGGTIATTPVQQQIPRSRYDAVPLDGQHRGGHDGNAAFGYNTSNATSPNFPSIAYAGRLVDDPPGTLPQTETQLIAGGGSQIFTCGGGNCDRWGDYSSMSVDPGDDCTFWYTAEYYETQAGSNNPASGRRASARSSSPRASRSIRSSPARATSRWTTIRTSAALW